MTYTDPLSADEGAREWYVDESRGDSVQAAFRLPGASGSAAYAVANTRNDEARQNLPLDMLHRMTAPITDRGCAD
jgi:hypothetical protein